MRVPESAFEQAARLDYGIMTANAAKNLDRWNKEVLGSTTSRLSCSDDRGAQSAPHQTNVRGRNRYCTSQINSPTMRICRVEAAATDGSPSNSSRLKM